MGKYAITIMMTILSKLMTIINKNNTQSKINKPPKEINKQTTIATTYYTDYSTVTNTKSTNPKRTLS